MFGPEMARHLCLGSTCLVTPALTSADVGEAVTARGADAVHEVRVRVRHDVVAVSELAVGGAGLERRERGDVTQLRQVENLQRNNMRQAVFTLVTRGRFLDVGVKFDIEPNGGIFDVNPKNVRASPNVKSPSGSSEPCKGNMGAVSFRKSTVCQAPHACTHTHHTHETHQTKTHTRAHSHAHMTHTHTGPSTHAHTSHPRNTPDQNTRIHT